MIPSVLGNQVRAAIEDFFRTHYPLSSNRFARTIPEFIERGEAFKGPYVSFQLPFKKGEGKGDFFPELPLGFPPYRHQERAFERLSQNQPTIVATGTGSGKTEAFLYPILDYCRLNQGQPGVKAIFIYPMNALATDQAGRIARLIHQHKCLKKVRAGLYIGSAERVTHKKMTANSVITHRYTMQRHPPDILLTNYKMLDYLMVRPQDSGIWSDNGPGTLQFLVVDELHTFDGAQGTDLSCLLRRLKHRLQSPDVTPVGTSATLGSEEPQQLLEYAQTIFGVPFDSSALITEERFTGEQFLGPVFGRYFLWPSGADSIAALDPAQYRTLKEYLAAQYRIWFKRRRIRR